MLPSLAVLWLTSACPDDGYKAIDGESAPPYTLSYRLYTGEYCSELLTSRPEIAASLNTLGPTIIFVLSAFVRSPRVPAGVRWRSSYRWQCHWPTDSLTPDQASSAFEHPLMLGSVGSVLAGAIFGDHCSPISDTTVLSSQSSGCDHVAHVWTQLPYAALVGAVTIIFGTLPIGLGISVWLLLPTGFAVLAAVLWFVGEKSTDSSGRASRKSLLEYRTASCVACTLVGQRGAVPLPVPVAVAWYKSGHMSRSEDQRCL